jgi:hypothetical protein
MKTISILIIQLFIIFPLLAPPLTPNYNKDIQEAILKYKITIAIFSVESNGNPDTVNYKENAVGISQIRPIMIKEANRIQKRFIYKNEMRNKPQISTMLFWDVISHRTHSLKLNLICRIWNQGHLNKKDNGYYLKVKREFRKFK